MLETLGLTPFPNKFTEDGSKCHSMANSYFLKSIVTELSDAEQVAFKDASKALREDVIRHLDVLITTHINAGSPELRRNFPAKVAFLDEASMPTIPSTLVVLEAFPGIPYILSGDHLQLDPVVPDPKRLPDCAKLLPVSLLELLLKRQWRHCELTICRRSARGVNDIPNSLFYHNTLEPSSYADDKAKFPYKAMVMEWVEKWFPAPAEIEKSNPNHKTLPFLHLRGAGFQARQYTTTSSHNVENVALVINIIQKLIREHPVINRGHIAIITPYKDQEAMYIRARTRAIRSFPRTDMEAWRRNRDGWMSIEIATVDSFQGGECRIVFSDMVITEKVGFLNNRGRLFVASSRAKDFWFCVGYADNGVRDDVSRGVQQQEVGNIEYRRISWPTKIYNPFKRRG